MRALSRQRRESGFTLVELMIAIFVLLVGVLGSVALVDGANRTSASTRAREGATNLARDIVEDTHDIPITQLAAAGENLQADIQNAGGPADADGAQAGWQVKARGFTYTVAVSVCGVDDPADGLGSQDSTFNWCAQTSGTADQNALDYARITVTVTWTDRGGTHTIKQGSVLNNQSNGPMIKTLDTNPSSGGTPLITDPSATVINFTATTDVKAASAEWFLNGTDQAAASSADGKTWTWQWNIGAARGGSPPCSTTGTGVLDGTYLVGLQAFDNSGLSSGEKDATVTLNRCPPLSPTNLIGGWDKLFPTDIELNWDSNPEGDIIGYYVYRGTSPSAMTQILVGKCSGLVKASQCTDDDPLATGASADLYYKVYAVDRDTTGSARMSPSPSATLLAAWGNQAPNAPVSVASGGTTSTLTWSRPTTQDPDTGDFIDYYRVYRVAAGTPASSVKITDRYDTVDNTGTSAVYTDPSPVGAGTATYYVTSVDNHGAESALTPASGVTR